jgi:alpha-glucosidase
MAEGPWWRDAICYEIYVRSFSDADGDGLGDLAGIGERLPYLKSLGIDAIWITPFYTSPQEDHGYDVADYRNVDERFGTLQDFDAMMSTAHQLGLKVIVDLVPNHTSSEHPWFQAALRAAPGSRERKRFVFHPGRGDGGALPPNNWQSVFGGPAWTRLPEGDWYLHLFDESQPDLNWRNQEVLEEFESILRFWLDRGVDGFRIDVAHGLIKHRDLPDRARGGSFHVAPFWDQPEVHTIYRRWHRVLAEYDGDRMAIAEAWADDEAKMAQYLRPDELQQAFNFHWLSAPWSAAAFRRVIERTFAAVDPVQASPTWVLSNHDVTREVTRYGGGEQGIARSRAATLAMLALPGSAYIYQGAELGLPQTVVPEKDRQDPVWLRGGGVGRDGCRVPMPWSGTARPFGFSPEGGAASWLPQPAAWRDLTVEAQDSRPDSTLNFFRSALMKRREVVPGLAASISLERSVPGVVVIDREPGFTCVLNCGKRNFQLARLGEGQARGGVGSPGRMLIASGHPERVAEGLLPADTAAWFQR